MKRAIVSLVLSISLTACIPAPERAGETNQGVTEAFFDDFSEISSRWQTQGAVVVNGSVILRGAKNGQEFSQSKLVSKQAYGYGTYASRVRFHDKGEYGSGRPVQAFYLISPKERIDQAFAEVDFEYLPAGGWSEYTDPRLHLNSWAAYGKNMREVSNRQIKASFDGYLTLITHVTPGEIRLQVYKEGSTEKIEEVQRAPYAPETPLHLAWRSRLLPGYGTPEAAYHMEVDWAMYSPEILNAQEIAQLIEKKTIS